VLIGSARGSDMTEKCVVRVPCSKEENELYEYVSVASAGERLTEVSSRDRLWSTVPISRLAGCPLPDMIAW
jgi:hypothetical protein